MAPEQTLPSHPPLNLAILRAPGAVSSNTLVGEGLALLAQGSDWARGLWYLDADNRWRWLAARTLLGQDLARPLDALAGEAVQLREEDALEDLFTLVDSLSGAVGALGIVDRQGNLTGAVTPESLLSALADWEIWRGLSVQWVAKKAVLWLAPEMTMEEVADLFYKKGINSGFLCKNTGEAALQITVHDLLRAYERQGSLGKTKVRDLLQLGTAPGWQIDLENSLNLAQNWMKGGAGVELAAVNSAGELVGQIGAGDPLSALRPSALLNWVGQLGQSQSALAEENQQLSQWRRRYEAAEQASTQVLYEYDFVNHQVIWGSNAKGVLGYAPLEMPRQVSQWIELIHPEDQSRFQEALETCVAQGTNFFCQYRLRHRRGHYLWLEDQNQWLGNRQGVVGMLTDITAHKTLEADLTRQKNFNQFIAEAASRLGNAERANLKDEIQRTLAQLGETVDADDCVIFSLDLDAETLSMTYEWRRPELASNASTVQQLPWSLFPWSIACLRRGEICYAPDLSQLPPEAATDVASWSLFSLKSVLAIPLGAPGSIRR
ncbi:MAG: PAS domain-containing protein, partial [Cyanobacteriota bacterium]